MILIYVILFVTLAIIILFGSHYLLYLSIINIFSITNNVFKNYLAIVLSVLAMSFMIATFLAMWKENNLTRGFYFISTFWTGVLVNLLLAVVALLIILQISQFTNITINSSLLGAILFTLAVSYSLWGMWNAMHPQIKNISVTIPNLPQNWKGKKIVQISDVHLGHIYRNGFMQNVVKEINTVKPEAVFITGDLFDGMDGDLLHLINPLNDIEAKKGTFFVTGNHETYLGVKEVSDALSKTKVRVMQDEVIDLKGLKIIGINYPARDEENKDIIETLRSLQKDFKGFPNILLYHSPSKIDEVKESGVNLQLSGHTHYGQIFPLGYITKLIYKGYDYGLYPMGDYTLYTTNGTGTWGPAMRTGNTPEIVAITLN